MSPLSEVDRVAIVAKCFNEFIIGLKLEFVERVGRAINVAFETAQNWHRALVAYHNSRQGTPLETVSSSPSYRHSNLYALDPHRYMRCVHMKLALIGVGQAGGKVLDEFLAYDARTGADIVRGAIAVNTAKADLQGIDRLPKDRRILIGQSRVKGHGVGADNELGAEVTEEDIDEIQGALDSVPVHEIDAFLIVAGLGGGTGSGGAPVIANNLKRIYTEPVYGLGILPGGDEGGIYTLNAARSLKTFVDEVDNLMLFDNDAWRSSGESG